MVTRNIHSVHSFEELRFFVYQTLCQEHELLMDAFPTTETVLKRGEGNDACAVMFNLYGPRSVKFSAIWEKNTNRVFFYGPCGKRYLQVELSDVTFPAEEFVSTNEK